MLRMGPASSTVKIVDVARSPAARTASPPARPVRATDATSVGAMPADKMPPRRATPLTRWLASQAIMGKPTVVTGSTTARRRAEARMAPISLKVMEAPVENTRTASVNKMASAASARRPGPGKLTPTAAEIRTRGRRKRSRKSASPVSGGRWPGRATAVSSIVSALR